MKKILIIPANTDLNRGDQALIWESARLVEDIYGKDNVSFSVIASNEGEASELQKHQTAALGFKFVPALLNHPSRKFKHNNDDSKAYTKGTMLKWGIQAILDYFHTFMLLSKCSVVRRFGQCFLNISEKDTLHAFTESDAIFVKGGGFLHSYGAVTDPYFIYFLTYHIRLAIALGKKVYMLPNSIGPLKNPIARRIAIKALKGCKLVTVRENISRDFLGSIGIFSELFPDLGFFLKPTEKNMDNYLAKRGVPIEGKKVVLTLRPYRFQGYDNSDRLYENYLNGTVRLVKHLHAKGYHTSFLAHTLGPSAHEDDRLAIKEVISRLDDDDRKNISYLEDINLTCRDVEKIYSSFDYMIGTRFHSVIFSLNVNVPSIAIAYGGNKGKGIMNILGNDAFSIDMDKIREDSLMNLFDKLEHEKGNYLHNLTEKRQVINRQREALIVQIQTLDKSNR